MIKGGRWPAALSEGAERGRDARRRPGELCGPRLPDLPPLLLLPFLNLSPARPQLPAARAIPACQRGRSDYLLNSAFKHYF